MDPITTSAATGMTTLQEYGLAGLFLSLIFAGGVWAIRYFATHCEKRTEAAVEAYKVEAAQNRAVIDKNTAAFYDMKIALTELRGSMNQ